MKAIILSILGLLLTVSVQAQQLGPRHSTDLADYIRTETIGGKLDFKLQLEDNKLYGYDGVAYSKKDFSIFLWGQVVKRLGIRSAKKAINLWEETHGQILTKPEKKALVKGFKTRSLQK